MKFTKAANIVFMVAGTMLLAACGDSGGGGDGGTSTDGVSFTEDTSLNNDMTGIWIASSNIEVSEKNLNYIHKFKGTSRDTVYIVDNYATGGNEVFGDIFVGACDGAAFNTTYDSTNLIFTLDGAQYSLKKKSNTSMSGTVKYDDVDDTINGGGTVTFIKVKAGLQSIDEYIAAVVSDESGILGNLTFSYNGQPNKTMHVNCYSDGEGTETYTFQDESESSHIKGITLEGYNDSVDITLSSGDDDTNYLDIEAGGIYDNFASDYEPGHVSYRASGRDYITISFDASMTRNSGDASSDHPTIEGTANLEF